MAVDGSACPGKCPGTGPSTDSGQYCPVSALRVRTGIAAGGVNTGNHVTRLAAVTCGRNAVGIIARRRNVIGNVDCKPGARSVTIEVGHDNRKNIGRNVARCIVGQAIGIANLAITKRAKRQNTPCCHYLLTGCASYDNSVDCDRSNAVRRRDKNRARRRIGTISGQRSGGFDISIGPRSGQTDFADIINNIAAGGAAVLNNDIWITIHQIGYDLPFFVFGKGELGRRQKIAKTERIANVTDRVSKVSA